jgi:AraC-like DNA-binding protein
MCVDKHWWTRSQRIRTSGELPFEAVLFEATTPAYRRIAQAAGRLRVLGLSLSTIATELGVSDKTVAKALRSTERPAGS